MENLSDIKVIKRILNSFGFKFSKSLGQNFIVDGFICPKMAESLSENKISKASVIFRTISNSLTGK